MSNNAISWLWNKIKGAFDADAKQLHRVFFAEDNSSPLAPNDSYLRLTLSELFLAKEVQWGIERFPAVQASVRLLFGGGPPKTFATLARRPDNLAGPGVFQDYELTYLLPYLGQAVELEVGLFEIFGKNNLGTAVDILSDFASLVAPPLSGAFAVMDKVSSGIEKVITANGTEPVLALHATLMPGGGVNDVQPGWLAVVRATEKELPLASLCVVGGRLHRRVGAGTEALTGFDYLVLRLEGSDTRAENSEWITPDLDAAISAASLARDTGKDDEFKRLREDALTKVYFSADFTPGDRKQIAKLLREELDDTEAGAAGEGDFTLASIVSRRGLPARSEVDDLTLGDLLLQTG